MRLSEKQRAKLSAAISEEIMKARVNLQRAVSTKFTSYAGGTVPAESADAALYYLEERVCDAAVAALTRDGRRS